MEEGPTKRERKKLAREQKLQEQEAAHNRKKITSLLIKLGVLAAVVWVGWVVWREFNRPFPGEAVPDMGREHVPVGTVVEYNSNPPTSGPHFSDWTRAGVYEEQIEDGYLVHSLEHGYVIMSYNCEIPATSLVSRAYAQNEEATVSGEPQEAGESRLLSEEWNNEECQELRESLARVFEKGGKRKLVVVPRPENDARIALTAWTRIQKLSRFDEETILNFINTYRDRGPEKTME